MRPALELTCVSRCMSVRRAGNSPTAISRPRSSTHTLRPVLASRAAATPAP